MTATSLEGLRVLIVEDEAMVAMLIEDVLAEIGCATVGIASRLEEAMSQVSFSDFDAAILDVNLNGHQTYCVAEALARRGIPFVWATGYGADGVPDDVRRLAPILAKPFKLRDLEQALAAALAPIP